MTTNSTATTAITYLAVRIRAAYLSHALYCFSLHARRGKKNKVYIVVEPRSTRDIEIMLFKLIVKVPVVGNTGDTPIWPQWGLNPRPPEQSTGRSVPEVVGSNPTGAKFSLVRGDSQISLKRVVTQGDLVYAVLPATGTLTINLNSIISKKNKACSVILP